MFSRFGLRNVYCPEHVSVTVSYLALRNIPMDMIYSKDLLQDISVHSDADMCI